MPDMIAACPWCGWVDTHYDALGWPNWRVICNRCLAWGPFTENPLDDGTNECGQAAALAAWNRSGQPQVDFCPCPPWLVKVIGKCKTMLARSKVNSEFTHSLMPALALLQDFECPLDVELHLVVDDSLMVSIKEPDTNKGVRIYLGFACWQFVGEGHWRPISDLAPFRAAVERLVAEHASQTPV